MWAYKCLISFGFQVLFVYFNIPLEKSQRLICLFGDIVNMGTPAEVIQYCDPEVFSSSSTF